MYLKYTQKEHVLSKRCAIKTVFAFLVQGRNKESWVNL